MEGMGCVEVATACEVGGWYKIANRAAEAMERETLLPAFFMTTQQVD